MKLKSKKKGGNCLSRLVDYKITLSNKIIIIPLSHAKNSTVARGTLKTF